jgi:hypothetical protein
MDPTKDDENTRTIKQIFPLVPIKYRQFIINFNNHMMMIRLTLISFLFLEGALAFSPSQVVMPWKNSAVVLQARPDSSAAVADALRISKEFGGTSSEARVAWEIVEEMDSADSSAAMPSSSSMNLSPEETHKMDYAVQVRALNQLLADTEEKMSQIKTLAHNLKEMETDDPTLAKLPPTATGLKTALQEAKAASEVHGPDSSESEAAWNEVEFCTDIMGGVECNVDSMYRYSAAALKAHHVYDAIVDSTFLQEAEDAVGMLENLRKFIRIETSRLNSK